MIMKRQFAFRLLIGVLAMLGLAACSDSDNFGRIAHFAG